MKRLPIMVVSAIFYAVAVALWPAPADEASAGAPAASPSAAVRQSTPVPSEHIAPVILKWTTKSEVNTAGFNIYRATTSDGPYAMINQDLIPASNDAIAGGQYVYTDTTAIAGVTYYYQLEDVEMSGKRARHDPFMITAGSASVSGGVGIDPAAIALLVVAALGLVGVIAWRIRSR